MKYGSLILEKKEYVYLKRILNLSGYTADFEIQKSLQKLTDELKTAIILDEDEMPDDVVRFNSSVVITSDNGWKKSLQIIASSNMDIKAESVSILTCLGAALFGYSEQDIITWEFPNGIKKLKIEVVAQEESNNKIIVPI